MQDRRRVLASLGAVVLAGCGGGEDGGTSGGAQCNLTSVPATAAQVNLGSFYQSAAQTQYQNLWCWAACIAMIFAQRGHPVSQARIVAEAYGAPYNMSAPGYVIAASLNRRWTDDRGSSFRATLTGLYDYYGGYAALSDATIINTLSGGTPMVLGSGGHARVLVEIDYVNSIYGPSIVGGRVFDPWTGQLQCLDASELTLASRGGALAFLASVAVA